MPYRPGRHSLQIPGPTNVPDRVLRAIARPTIDHRGPEFALLGCEILEGLRRLFGNDDGEVFVYPGSGNGGWEAALVNTLSLGDRVLAFDNGFFANGWSRVAERLGLRVEQAECDWRRPVPPELVAERLADDSTSEPYRAVLLVHNETTTGVRSDVAAARGALDQAGHAALLMVDAVSSLGSMPLPQQEWGVDVVVAGSQKGLMLPPGLGFTSAGPRALRAASAARLPRAYWDWAPMRDQNPAGYFPFTPATNLLFGLREALSLLAQEGDGPRFARHERLARATRAAVEGWGLSNYCDDPQAYSPSLTAVEVPEGTDADSLRATILERFDVSLGTGLGRLKGRLFRIGHLGDLNEVMLAGVLAGIELGLRAAGIGTRGGVDAALDVLGAPEGA